MARRRAAASAERCKAIRRRLLAWYRRSGRALPWRETRDPYAIWVSEIMLQQTTVAAAAPFYERWMARFPTLESLARADEEDVLHLWSGLGYYNRAKNLHQAAQIVAAEHGGELPQELSELLLLPGIGRYTAGAIASIAFGKRVPAVDVNISRVLARLDALREPITSAIAQEIVWEEAAALAKTSNPGDLNQALMELGALICSPTAPDCPSCPVRPLCRAAERGDPERYPTRPARPQVVEVTEVGAAIERDGRWLFLRRQEGARMAGMWEIPHSPVRGEKPATAVAPLVRALTGLNVAIEEHLATISHTFTHHHVTLHVWRASAPTEGRVRRQQHAAHQWATLDQIARRPMSTPQRRVVAALREAAQGRQLDLLASAHSVGPAGFG